MDERIERRYSLARRVIVQILIDRFFSFLKSSCQFVTKIMSVCGKNHAGLWEKFVGLKKSLENTRRAQIHKQKPDYLCLFAEVPHLTMSI